MLNLADVIKWSLRKSTRDVVNMYEALSPLMCQITGGRMLNFGYWDERHCTPVLAQQNMCSVVAGLADLESVSVGGNRTRNTRVLDVGSGLGDPAAYWMNMYAGLDVCCVNTSYLQLLSSLRQQNSVMYGSDDKNNDALNASCDAPCTVSGNTHDTNDNTSETFGNRMNNTDALNASATVLPFADSSIDRIISLESAQHFVPLEAFAAECRRVMRDSAVLAIAIPIVMKRFAFTRLGILNVTWASAHPTLDYVRNTLYESKFEICTEDLVGRFVYGPLADYYAANRTAISEHVHTMGYPARLEDVIAASMRQMKKASDDGVIEYALMQCRPRSSTAG